MCMLVRTMIELHAKFEMHRFTSSKDVMRAQKFETGSCDLDHAHFGGILSSKD